MENNSSDPSNKPLALPLLLVAAFAFCLILGGVSLAKKHAPKALVSKEKHLVLNVAAMPLKGRTAHVDPELFKLGETTFNSLCVACHQAGGIGKVGFAPGIRNHDFLALASDDYLRNSIRAGRPGTAMVPWSALSEKEVAGLIAYLRAGNEGYVSELSQDPDKKIAGAAGKGEITFATYCASCHGPNAEGYAAGGSGPGIGLAGFLMVASDDFIMQTVKHGRAGTAMLPFVGAKGLANLKEDDVGDIIAYLRSLPGKPKVVEAKSDQPADPKAGKMHFDANCMACHQPGGLGKAGFAPSIRNRDFLALTSDDFIRKTVKHGRLGTAMLPRPDLSDKVMGDIIAYLRSLPTKTTVEVKVDHSKKFTGDVKLGHQKFASYCLSCHGEKGTGYVAGGAGPAIGLAGFLSVASDDYIYQTVKLGRVGTAMKSFIGAKGLANLNDQDVYDIISYLRSLN
ncbi:MAG: c-type cytochrome [Verrucomicrobiales bacterium]|nr:c-type cytochrome [Verrucomicrobiales bacterium]